MPVPPNLPFDPVASAPPSPAPVTPPKNAASSIPTPPSVTPPVAPPPVPSFVAPVSPKAAQIEDMFSSLEAKPATPKPTTSSVYPTTSVSVKHYILIGFALFVGIGLIGGGFWYLSVYFFSSTIKKTVLPATPIVETGTGPQNNQASGLPQEIVPEQQQTVPPYNPEIPTQEQAIPTESSSYVPLPETAGSPVTTSPPNTNIPLPTSIEPGTIATPPAPANESLVDSDQDRLTDIRETELGTDIRNADTDADTVSDGDEVLTYQTNPINPDTDGDSYPDGVEIKNGFNPRGNGKCAKPNCEL